VWRLMLRTLKHKCPVESSADFCGGGRAWSWPRWLQVCLWEEIFPALSQRYGVSRASTDSAVAKTRPPSFVVGSLACQLPMAWPRFTWCLLSVFWRA